MDKSTKQNKKTILVVGIILVVLVIVCGIFFMKNMKKDNIVLGKNSNIVEESYSDEMKAISIKTPYCDLYYPQKWESNLKTETVSKKDTYTVQFWSKFKGENSVQLFDITFGGKKGNLGTIESKDGKKVYVSIDSYDFKLDDTWTEKDKMKINSMVKDINYLLNKLGEVKGFEPTN